MTTRTLTDIKDITEADLQKRVNLAVRAYVEADNQNTWLMGDEAHTIYLVNKYNPKDINGMYRRGFCIAYQISPGEKYGKDNQVKNTEYHTFSVLIARIVKVACIDDTLYQKYRNSGRSLYSVWAELTTSKKKMKQIEDKADKEISKLNAKQQLEKDVAEGVANAEELLKKVKNTSPVKETEPKEEESKAWTAPPVNEDLTWVQGCRKICRQSPQLFVRMIKSCVDNGYLSEVSYKSIKEDLKL
jgi:ferredoxin-thioredoxin reductase catalytic subunit